MQSGHVSSPGDSKEWVWVSSAHSAMHVLSIFGEEGRRRPRRWLVALRTHRFRAAPQELPPGRGQRENGWGTTSQKDGIVLFSETFTNYYHKDNPHSL